MTTTLVLGQDVNLSRELGVAGNGARLRKDLSAKDVLSVDTAEKKTDVVACLSVVKKLSEHLDTGNDSLSAVLLDTDELDFVVELQRTSLHTTGSNGTTTGDREDVLDRHQERLVVLVLRLRNCLIDCCHEVHDLVAPRAVRILKSLESGTADDRDIVAREVIVVQELSDLHLDEVKKLLIVDHVALVHEDNDVRNVNLTCKQDVLAGLRHNTVGCSNDEDSAVHLCSTGDHVLDIVSVAGAVNVSVVTRVGLVLDVGGVDRDSTLSLLRSLIDVLESDDLVGVGGQSGCENLRDCRSQSGLAVVDVADGADVAVGLSSVKFSLCH